MEASSAKTHGRIVIYDRFHPKNQLGLMALAHKPLHCQSTSMAVHVVQLAVAHVPPAGPGRLGNGQPASKHALLTSE